VIPRRSATPQRWSNGFRGVTILHQPGLTANASRSPTAAQRETLTDAVVTGGAGGAGIVGVSGDRMSADEQIRQHIFERQRKRWRRIAREPGVLGKVLRFMLGNHPAEGVFIAEHEAADPDSCLCAGNVTDAWRLDRDGLREVVATDVDAGRIVGRLSQYQIVRFFISDDGQQVFLNEMEGPKQGTLMYMEPKVKDGRVEKLKVIRARVVLGGHALG
jgi:hypothetical protein